MKERSSPLMVGAITQSSLLEALYIQKDFVTYLPPQMSIDSSRLVEKPYIFYKGKMKVYDVSMQKEIFILSKSCLN
jgi:hypothetical protein